VLEWASKKVGVFERTVIRILGDALKRRF